MRRFLLIILAFVPAIAAVILFRSLDRDPKPAVPTAPEGGSQLRDTIEDALTGFSGTGTFYSRLSPIVLEGKQVSYPSTYYLLDEWRREEGGDFVIDGLLVVRNAKPRNLADLEGSLLEIDNSGGAAARRRRLEEARPNYDSLEAGRARASGGRTVADSDSYELEGGVEALVPTLGEPDTRLRIVSERAKIGLAEGRLQVLEIPTAFTADHPRYLLSGEGLRATESRSDVFITRAPLIEARGLPDGSRRRIEAKGGLRWRPDPLADGAAPDILDRVHLDFGEVDVEDEVLIVVDDIELRGRKAHLRIGDRKGGMRGKLSSFELEGEVVMDSPRGRVQGDRARGRIEADGSMALEVTGRRSTVLWRPTREAEQGLFEASCTGPIQVKMPSREMRESRPLALAFDGDVVLDLSGRDEPVHLEGENLVVELARVSVAREGADPVEAWRFVKAVLRGRAKGRARGYEVASPRIEIRRSHDTAGLHLDDRIAMEGPVHVERAGGLGRSDPELRSVIDARRRLELKIPARPGDDLELMADGHVRVRENRGRTTERSLDCEHVEVVQGPEQIAPGVERQVLKSLLARDSVLATDEKGSSLRGELVTWTRALREGRVEGRPARANFVDARGRRQDLAADVLEFNSAGGRVTGAGNVAAKLHFPALRLADEREKTDEELVEGRPPVPWDISCSSFSALFTGTLPLGDRPEGEERVPAELAEFDLQGDVKVENPEQRILADSLHYDLRRTAGTARGRPLRLRALRELGRGERVEDWLEADSAVIEPDWTLLQGKSRALLHVVAEKQEPGRPRRFEDLRIDSRDDVLLKRNELIFSGRTRMTRGVPAEGGLDLQADAVTATFAPAPNRKSGRGELQRVVGIGSVGLAWRDLEGEGELLTVDYVEKRVVLEAKPGGNCSMRRGRGYTARSEVVIYDMDSRKITQTRLRVEKRSTEGEKE